MQTGSYGAYVGQVVLDVETESMTVDDYTAKLVPRTTDAEIGVVNPGGLRADLLYVKEGPETEEGQVRYAEANAVLPFVNNLWTTTLTGE